MEEKLRKGVINLDKPPGPTSHEVVAWIRDILGVKKVGHSGTLDPKVTGVLPILFGKATKLSRALAGCEKEYVCLMKLHGDAKPEEIKRVCERFTGKIYQRPPLKAAVKRKLRVKEVYYIQILENERRNVLMKVGCESGVYIRKLCHDIGLALGAGAHMVQLRRTKVGPFSESNSATLQDLKDAYIYWKDCGDESLLRKIILPLDLAVDHLSKVIIKDSAVDAICHGANLAIPGIFGLDEMRKGDLVAVLSLSGELVCIGVAKLDADDIKREDIGIAIETKSVFMEPGTYPKGWK